MDSLRKQAAKFGTRFEQVLVQSVDFSVMPRRLVCADRTILAKTRHHRHRRLPADDRNPRREGALRRQGRDHLRHLRRRLLPQDGRRRHRRRRQRRRGGPLSDPFREQGLPRPPARLAAGLQDHGRARHVASQDPDGLGQRPGRGHGRPARAPSAGSRSGT